MLKATTDLDIREASFNNESKELEENHKEEVEQLIRKNEALSQRISELSEKMARQTAECDSKLEEMFKAKKGEVGDLKSQLAEKESQVSVVHFRIRMFTVGSGSKSGSVPMMFPPYLVRALEMGTGTGTYFGTVPDPSLA